jgi:predicted acylesterase/phospholipase RssA
MRTALVLSAGGMFGAYQAGAWKALAPVFSPDMITGASVGAWNGWAISGGCSPEELVARWSDPESSDLMKLRVSWKGIFNPRPLEQKAQELFARFSPRVPYAATLVELPRLRLTLAHGGEMTWRHLLAAASVPGGYPPVRIGSRSYVDGGLLGILPIWAAGAMGATHVVAIEAMPFVPSRAIRAFMRVFRWFRPQPPLAPRLQVSLISPGRPLGGLRDAVVWNAGNARRWIEKGERDAERLIKLGLCRTTESIV